MTTKIRPKTVALSLKCVVNLVEVILLIGDINYTTIHLVDNKKHLLSYTLSKLEKQLNTHGNFIRLNRSQIANKDFVCQIIDNKVIMKNNECFEMSRRRKNECLNYLK